MPCKDPQARKKILKTYRIKNSEKIALYRKMYRLTNKEIIAERRRKYWLKNPEKRRESKQRRRARKRGLESTLTVVEWEKILADNFFRCHYCGKQDDNLTQDHKIPLSKGGGYTKDNIVPACRSCNSSKSTKDYKKFVQDSKDRLQTELF